MVEIGIFEGELSTSLHSVGKKVVDLSIQAAELTGSDKAQAWVLCRRMRNVTLSRIHTININQWRSYATLPTQQVLPWQNSAQVAATILH
jgi:hypothetical protein